MKRLKEIIKSCKLNKKDIDFIKKTENCQNDDDLLKTLEIMLENQQIKIGG